MRPRVKSTVLWSICGLSLALNAALAAGQLRGGVAEAEPPAASLVARESCLLDRLELDAVQQRRLGAMRRTMQGKRAAYWQRAAAIKGELAEALSATRADRATLDAPLERYAENQAAMQRAVAEHLLGVSAMLRPAQREVFKTLLRAEMFQGIRSTRSAPAGAR